MSRFPTYIPKLLLGAALTTVCWGQSDQPDPEDRNHGVARISLLNGDVSVRRGDSGDFVAGAVNAPLQVQDSIQTGQASRAEVQFDSANRLRLGESVEVRMAELVANRHQVQLARGTTTVSVLRDSTAQIEVDTPSVAVLPSRNGDYRITVLDDGTTEVTVRSGEARIESARGEERLIAGQTMMARGSSDNPEFQIVAAIGRDDWDVFNERRDHELERSESYRYVSRDIAGAEDLDGYGQWETDPTYGQVWAPRVAADWAPYRSGRWVWEDYYGWTWVSYDPWGWAPYHYGNWFVGTRGWCWYPGPLHARYWYRPALVGFFGFGGGVGVGLGSGHIGWVPLAPFEAFHPWYGHGFGGGYRGFGGGVNITNVNVTNVYRNARFTNGVTAMNSQDFANGRFGRFSNVGQNELRQASLVHGALPVTPTSGSLRFNDRQTAVVGRNSFQQTRFAGRNQPRQSGGRQFGQSSQTGGAPGTGGFGRNAAPPEGNSGGQRFGSPNQNSGQAGNTPGSGSFGRNAAPAAGNSGGQRFGSSNQNSGRQFAQAGQPGSTAGSGSFGRNSAPPAGNSGWQRFGSPNQQNAGRQFGQSGSAPGTSGFGRNAAPASGNPGWQRFGSPNPNGPAPALRNQGSFARPSTGSGMPAQGGGSSWQRFGSPNSNSPGGRGEYSRPSYQSSPAPAMRNFVPQGGSRSVQVAPPLVRERPGSGSYSQPGFRSAPAPSYRSAPSQSYPSAPAHSYGGAPSQSFRSAPAQGHSNSGGGGSHGSSSGGGSPHRGR